MISAREFRLRWRIDTLTDERDEALERARSAEALAASLRGQLTHLRRLPKKGRGICTACGAKAPLVERLRAGAKVLVVYEHYPETTAEPYAAAPGNYCRGSGKAPREVVAA